MPQKFRIGNQTTLDVTLKEAANQLEEVVVVGYGTQKKRDVVGAVEQVSGKIFEQRANPSPVRSLQGQVAGLNITMNDGKASRRGHAKIRGAVSSIGAGGSALVLVDGGRGPNSRESRRHQKYFGPKRRLFHGGVRSPRLPSAWCS